MEDYQKVEEGMSEAEVRAILGSPPKVLTVDSDAREFYRPHKAGEKVFLYRAKPHPPTHDVLLLNVRFAPDGTVNGKGYGGGKQPSLRQWFEAWLRGLHPSLP